MKNVNSWLVMMSLAALAGTGCAVDSIVGGESSPEQESVAPLLPTITRPSDDVIGNARLDSIFTAAKEQGVDRLVVPYQFDLRAAKNGAVGVKDATNLAVSLFADRVDVVYEREMIPAKPFEKKPDLKLQATAAQIASAITGTFIKFEDPLPEAISNLDPRVREEARVFEIMFKPGQAGPQSAFLFFDTGAANGKGSCVAAAANIVAR